LINSNIFLFSKTSHPNVNHIPIIETNHLSPHIDFSKYDYIIATSKEVFNALDSIGQWKHLPILTISNSTANYAKSIGCSILDISSGYAKDIHKLIKNKYSNLNALYPHAESISFDIALNLKDYNINIDSIPIYKTSCSNFKKVELPLDAICIFTSPSSIKCFLKNYSFLPSYTIICIGNTTSSSIPSNILHHISNKQSIESAINYALYSKLR